MRLIKSRRIHFTTNRLRVLRAERRWTQEEVAYRMGLGSKFHYWQIENEEVAPTDKERKKLARIFNATEAAIWPTRHADADRKDEVAS